MHLLPSVLPRDADPGLRRGKEERWDGKRSTLLPLETRPDFPGESGMPPEIPVTHGEEYSVLDTSLDMVYFALQ